MIIPPSEMHIDRYHHSAPRWWSKTSLRYYQDHGPAWVKLWLDDQIKPPTPDGAEVGLALDCYLTEGADAFIRRFPTVPANAPKKPTKAQREAKKPSPDSIEAIKWWDDFYATYGRDCIILNADDRQILTEAADAVRRLPCWPEIEASAAQMTVRRDSPGLGIGLQARPDWLDANRGKLYDLKKTRSLRIFGRQAIDLGYHLQAAVAGWCLAGDSVQIEQASLIAVEWERGARARQYVIPHEALAAGDRAMRELAAEVADRIRRDDWTDRQPQAEPLDIPEWMMRKMEASAA